MKNQNCVKKRNEKIQKKIELKGKIHKRKKVEIVLKCF